MLKLIDHPDMWKEGTRVLLLKGRHKDGIEKQRTRHRVTHNVDEFESALYDLHEMAHKNERIYATASPRDITKAIRLFKERQLASDYDDDPTRFYQNVEARWVSCLMNKGAQDRKWWIFDCDSPEELMDAEACLNNTYLRRTLDPYQYDTKTGHHIVVLPFNKVALSDSQRGLLHTNPLMLWGY